MTDAQRAIIEEEIDAYVCEEALGGSAPDGLLDALEAALAESRALEKVRGFRGLILDAMEELETECIKDAETYPNRAAREQGMAEEYSRAYFGLKGLLEPAPAEKLGRNGPKTDPRGGNDDSANE